MCSTPLIVYSIAILSRKCHFYWYRRPSSCMSLVYFPRMCPCDSQLYQAVKDVSTSYDALVDLLESIEHLMNRLNIYISIPTTGAMTEIIVKIIVELISVLALVTKQIKQRRPSEYILTDLSLI